MGSAWKLSAFAGVSLSFFFAVGAMTGPAGWAATSSYLGTVGTGAVNTGHGLAYAASGGTELLSKALA